MQKHRFLIKALFCFLIVLFCTACSQIFGEPTDRRTFFQLQKPEGFVVESVTPTRPEHLVVRPMRSNPFLNSYKIVFSKEPSTRAYYQRAQWTEPPPHRLTDLLEAVLLDQKGFATITPFSVSSVGDLELHLELKEFFHDAATTPGQAVVEITAEVVSRIERKVLARTTIRETVALESYDSTSAVSALTHASFTVMQKIGVWAHGVK